MIERRISSLALRPKRHILAEGSHYSWTKWIRISLLVPTLMAAIAFRMNFSGFVPEVGIVWLMLFLLFFTPFFAIFAGLDLAIGIVPVQSPATEGRRKA